MHKLSFATFALLYSSQFTQGVKVHHFDKQSHTREMPDHSLLKMHEDDAPNKDMYLQIPNIDLAKHAPKKVEVTETELIQTEAKVSFSPNSCRAGVDRMHSYSNKQSTYEAAVAAGVPWEDPEFEADDTSLTWADFGFGEMSSPIKRGMEWKRPGEMGQGFPTSPSLYGDAGVPLPQGIRQMGIADCWFLAGTAAVAEKADRIYNVMQDRQYNAAGAFRFYFYVINEWVGINVDDRVPVTPWGDGFRPYATWPSKLGAWWMPLLEKAYAKLNQNYDRIGWGRGSEAIRTLSGMPTTSLDHAGAGAAQLWQRHRHWAQMDYPQVASCCNNIASGIDGLTSGHAYSLLDVRQLLNEDGTPGPRLAKMRNPWSKEGYNGKWSDTDSSWTDNFKKQVDLKVADDGIFWMPYENYQNFFQSTSVGFTNSYKTASFDLELSKRQTAFRISNPTEQYLYVTAETYSHRHFPRAQKCIPGHEVVLYFQKSDGSQVDSLSPYEFVKWDGFGTVGNTAGKLPAGDYTLFVVDQAGDHTKLSLHLYADTQEAKLFNA